MSDATLFGYRPFLGSIRNSGMTNEYLVIYRAGEWWTTMDGSRLGPYPSEKIAVDAAKQLAKLDYRKGQAARVSVDEPDDGVPVVYDPSLDTDL